MENATKALLIAAAVLIAIIIISLTLAVVRQGQEAVTGADMSEAEQAAFNSKFTSYEGDKVSAAQVNALLNAVLAHNQQQTATGEGKYVKVTAGTSGVSQATGATSISRVSSGYYKVALTYGNGIVTEIKISQ